jgi:cytochrome c553
MVKYLILFFSFILSNSVLAGDAAVGEKKFTANKCISCHGPQGMGIASYPRIGGKDVKYLTERLNTYRSGEKVGPNSDLMIMNAKNLTDEDIDDLTSYLSIQEFD